MDNKEREPGFNMDIPLEEYFDTYYDEFTKTNREIVYLFEDVVIQKPHFMDFRHEFKCACDDAGIDEEETEDMTNPSKIFKLRDHVLWVHLYDRKNDGYSAYSIFKDGEYAGYLIFQEMDGDLKRPVLRHLDVRDKFNGSIVDTCIVDFISNVKYKEELVILGGLGSQYRNDLAFKIEEGAFDVSFFNKKSGYLAHIKLTKDR